jgi:hypothetical protein
MEPSSSSSSSSSSSDFLFYFILFHKNCLLYGILAGCDSGYVRYDIRILV